ncbi:quinolinate synthase NadA [bacterium]|nr:quinolinate synthase NadA [bacterium]
MNNLSLVEKIMKLKEKRKAVILVHNYQRPEVQDIADYLGDSLELSRKAAQTDAKVIVFCGVHFMAETAAILSPDKTVLMPDINAGCPMADMVNAEKVKELKRKHPEAAVVSYVNTTAEVKTESDVCCTSANATEVVKSVKSREIIFLPDKYLGHYVSCRTGKNLILVNGYCPVHLKILAQDIKSKKEKYPGAEVLVHPECIPEVIALADKTLSTSGMCKYAKDSKVKEMIIGTEVGIIYRLQKENPDKKFYPASEIAICPNMKLNNLEKVLWALEDMKFEVKVEKETRIKAKKAIDKMLQFSRIN